MASSASSIAIVIGSRCNIRCRHCCFSCGPKSSQQLSDEQILAIIDQTKQDPAITTVGLSGGEVMLRRPLVLKAIRRISSLDKQATLTSNGFWGQTPAKARRDVQCLKEAGLKMLTLSYDSFHATFIPVNRLRNILIACREMRLRCHLNMAVTRSQNGDDLISELGESILGVPITKFPVQPVGEASHLPPSDIIRDVDDMTTLRCPGFEPTYHFDGGVYPCCSPCVFTTPLRIGRVDGLSVADAMRTIRHNALLGIIRREGFVWIYHTCKARGMLPSAMTHRFVDSCDLCRQLLGSERVLRDISKDLIAHYREVYEAPLRA